MKFALSIPLKNQRDLRTAMGQIATYRSENSEEGDALNSAHVFEGDYCGKSAVVIEFKSLSDAESNYDHLLNLEQLVDQINEGR